MKKQILLFIGLFIMLGASAQTAIGLKAGLNGSTIYEKPAPSPSSVLRTNLGLVCNFGYTKAVSFQMEANYSRKGGKFLDDSKLTYGYLEIPLLLKIGGGNENFKVFVLAGPFIGAPLKEEYKVVGADKTIATTTEDGIDGNPVIEKMDVGFHVGAGITYKMGPGRLLAEIRYCQGFGENFVEDSYNTRVFQFNVGYLFTFGD